MDSYIILKDNLDKRPILLLFEFVEFLYLNIDYFNQYVDEILIHKAVLIKQDQLGNSYKDILKNRELSRIIEAKECMQNKYIINPLIDKEIDCFKLYDEPSKNLYSSFSGLTSLLINLSEEFEEGDINAIMKAKKQYLEFRNRISPHIIILYLGFFEPMDKLMKIIINDFKIDGDRTIPKVENYPYEDIIINFDDLDVLLTSHQNKKIGLKNTERYPLKTDRIEILFKLIDYLMANTAIFKEHINIVKEFQQLYFVEKNIIGKPKNYKEKIKLLDIENRLKDLETKINNNIVKPLRSKVLQLKVCHWDEQESLVERAKGDIEDLKNYPPSKEFIELIQKYEKKYVEFREIADIYFSGYSRNENACYSYGYDDECILFFTDLHTSLSDLFGFFGADEMFKEQYEDIKPTNIIKINHKESIDEKTPPQSLYNENHENEEEKTLKPFFLPQSILNELQKEGFIIDANERPITWLKNKQLLRELLMHKNIKKESFKNVDVQKATPYYFINRKNNPIKLANNKPEPSEDSDKIDNICEQVTI